MRRFCLQIATFASLTLGALIAMTDVSSAVCAAVGHFRTLEDRTIEWHRSRFRFDGGQLGSDWGWRASMAIKVDTMASFRYADQWIG